MVFIDKLAEIIPCVISRRTSFITMTFLLGSFFLVEIFVGYLTNSMALIADAFHMLSDVASLIVGFLALKYSTIQAPRDTYTYGYARAEVLGALVNAVFLVALCFSIFIEAMKRLVILEEIENPMLVFIVGAVGLVVNIFGMFLFHQTGHGHTHGGMSHSHSHGHGHSHSGHGHNMHGDKCSDTKDKNVTLDSVKSHSTPITQDQDRSINTFSPVLRKVNEENGTAKAKQHPIKGTETIENHTDCKQTEAEDDEVQKKNAQLEDNNCSDQTDETEMNNTVGNESSVSIPIVGEDSKEYKRCNLDSESERFNRTHIKNISAEGTTEDEEKEAPRRFPTKFKSAAALNIHAVYLHILGDALGSIIVMLSALIIIYANGTWTLYVDPAMSIIMVAIILKTSIPLLIETSKILMNSVPHHIQVNKLKKQLMEALPQIKNVHELHIWQLAGDKIIASAHVKLESPSEYEVAANSIKDFFHNEGIHSTTIQIEYDKKDNIERRGQCMVVCSLDSACDDMMCCKPEDE